MKLVVDGEPFGFEPDAVIVAGFTGRDRKEVDRHVAELAAQGIVAPLQVPAFYCVPPWLLMQTSVVEASHPATSGEAEIAIVVSGDQQLVTIASDHTDRRAEGIDIELSKLACPKVISSEAWRLADIDDWDGLCVRSWVGSNGEKALYQEGRAADLLSVADLLELAAFERLPHSYVVLTGTFPAIGGIRPAKRFTAELSCPSRNDRLELSYTTCVRELARRGVPPVERAREAAAPG